MIQKIYDIEPILVDMPMPIITPRLILRPPQAEDGAKLAAAIKETWDDLNLWMRWAKDFNDSTDAEKREILCRQQQAKFLLRENQMLFAFERESGDFAAGTGLHDVDWLIRRFEIGYWVCKSKQGRGYATEITNALTRYAFDVLSARMVVIGHAEGNKRSQRVIEKLGFVHSHRSEYGVALPDDTIVADHMYTRENTDGLPDIDVRWGEKP